jgi:hypothetical protein
MHGQGKYYFRDGKTYQGYFHHNKPHGQGVSIYPCDSEYQGEYKQMLYDGVGRLHLHNQSSTYHGEFSIGRREGKGCLQLACQLSYDGDYLNGMPHGRGIMSSTLTGYSYEGTFDRGNIAGSGVLCTPDGTRIVRFWSYTDEDLSLPGIVRKYLYEKEKKIHDTKTKMEMLTSVKRGLDLRTYLQYVRTNLQEMREKRFTEDLNERRRMYVNCFVKCFAC